MKSLLFTSLILALPVFTAALPQQSRRGLGALFQGAQARANGGAGQANVQKSGNTANNAQKASNNAQKADANTQQNQGSNQQNNQNLSDNQKQQIQAAIDGWMRDTGIVSNFLDNSESFASDSTTFVSQSNVANSAEIDELAHKQVLDQFLVGNKNVDQANKTLVGGAFQLVVDQLQVGVDKGPAVQQSITDAINNDRCIDVLPNIDTYLQEAGKMIGATQLQSAVRPSQCAQVSAAASSGNQNLGFQGNPPPQAAIDALRTSASSTSDSKNNKNSDNNAVNTSGTGTRAQQSALAANNNVAGSSGSAASSTKASKTTAAPESAGAKNTASGAARKAATATKAAGGSAATKVAEQGTSGTRATESQAAKKVKEAEN